MADIASVVKRRYCRSRDAGTHLFHHQIPKPEQKHELLLEIVPLIEALNSNKEAFEALKEKFPEAVKLVNSGKLDEAENILRSLPLAGHLAGEKIDRVGVKEFVDHMQRFFKIFNIKI
ncbi:hypothetical protein Avbf_14387 [Armadillidium vulgare]|nr:hypothetical protein Avbf_14387 [Armadillidium vulgare]